MRYLLFVNTYFNSHYNSFVVKETQVIVCVPCNNLAFHRPLTVHRSFMSSDKNVYISIPNTY